jgi:hypothetical protein
MKPNYAACNSQIQNPNVKKPLNSNIQIIKHADQIVLSRNILIMKIWHLVIWISLGFGYWDFGILELFDFYCNPTSHQKGTHL